MTSVIQGVAITAGTLTVYQLGVSHHLNENTTRAMVFTTLIAANIFLTLVNKSFYFSALTTLKYKYNLVALIFGITIALTVVLLYMDPFTAFFQFESLTNNQLWTSIGFGFISVIWYELVKGIKRVL